jgi:hypothetical protein
VNVFKHLSYFTQKTAIVNQPWYEFCDSSGPNFRKLPRLEKYHYFPQNSYVVGGNGCKYNSDSPSEETIFSFNMRNMAIQGKLNNRFLKQIRKDIVYLILSVLPVYMLLALSIYFLCRGSKPSIEAETKKKQKKNQ